jgi:LysM repeat protein
MNSQQSPLVPQGQLLDPKNKGRARVKIAVFFVLAVHGIGLMALLMQGCRREEPTQPPLEAYVDTNEIAAPTMDEMVYAPIDTNYAPPTPEVERPSAPTPPPFSPPQVPPPTTPSPGVTEYKVVSGDNYTLIAKKFNVTVKAIADANPNVDPLRLQIGQPLRIPAPTPAAPTVATQPAANGQIYTVVSGDNLTKIADKYGVTVKALRSANNLTTDRITVGQKLKIPAKGQ